MATATTQGQQTQSQQRGDASLKYAFRVPRRAPAAVEVVLAEVMQERARLLRQLANPWLIARPWLLGAIAGGCIGHLVTLLR